MLPDFIPDGYTRRVGFNATAMHNAFDFTYRPFAGPASQAAWGELISSKDDETRSQLAFATIIARVSRWSYGRALDAAALYEMNAEAFDKLMSVVYGRRAPDWDRDNPAKADAELHEADAGNSNGG